MYQPLHPHVPTPPTKKLKIIAATGIVAVALLTLAVTILSLQLRTQYRRTNEQATVTAELTSALSSANDQLTLAKRQLIIQSMLPDYDSFPAQCPGGNEKDSLFTPLSMTPIEGYNVFLVDCRAYITTGKSLPRVLIFKVGKNSIDYVYGATASEPLCITNKLPVANKLAQQLSLPVCQTN
jgi:hypothetical protein